MLDCLGILLARGVKTFDFCGGEPTIHPALPSLLQAVHVGKGRSKVTTNAIVIPDHLIAVLRSTNTKVKVSLHGDREYHNAMVGCDAFDSTTRNLRRLMEEGIPVVVQTTVVAGGLRTMEWVVAFCLENHVPRMGVLPFIPRGLGYERRAEFGLSVGDRRALRDLVKDKRRTLRGRLDLRWLDFNASPVPVVEPDGRMLIEGPTEAMDKVLCLA